MPATGGHDHSVLFVPKGGIDEPSQPGSARHEADVAGIQADSAAGADAYFEHTLVLRPVADRAGNDTVAEVDLKGNHGGAPLKARVVVGAMYPA